MRTKSDTKYLEEKFVTKEYFDEFKSELFSRLDVMAGYMKKSDEEQTVMAYRILEQTGEIDSLVSRLSRIEQTLDVSV